MTGNKNKDTNKQLFAFYDTQLNKYSSKVDIDDMLDYLQEGETNTSLSLEDKIRLVQEYNYEVMPLDVNKLGNLLNFVKGEMPTSVQETATLQDILDYASNTDFVR